MYIIICIIVYVISACCIQFRINGFLTRLCRTKLILRNITVHTMVFGITPGTSGYLILYFAIYMKGSAVGDQFFVQLLRIQIWLRIDVHSSGL